jgi:hypothetical protein
MTCTRPVIIVAAKYAVPYNGTNSAHIAAIISDFTVTGETSTELTFTSGGQTFTVARDGYIAYAAGVVTQVFNTGEDLHHTYATVSAAGHVHDLVLTSEPGKPAETY